jgi:phage terminase small subunit
MRPLTAQQQRFVEEYLREPNGASAYRRAGYKVKSNHAAASCATKLLSNAVIAEAIRKGQEARSGRTGVELDRVVTELARLAFSDPRKLFNADGTLKPITTLDDDTAAALASFEIEEEFDIDPATREKTLAGYTRKVKQWDKLGALKTLLTHLVGPDPKAPVRVDVTSGGKAIEPRRTLTPADIAAARQLVALAMEGGGVRPDDR